MARRTRRDYPGPSASKTYDKRFVQTYAVPHLKTRVPQGLTAWSNWDGDDDLLMISAYSPNDKHACIIGVNASNGKHVGTAKVKASHVGGIAIFQERGWVYLSSGPKFKVRRYALDRLSDAIRNSSYIKQDGADIEVFGSSFLANEGSNPTLWAGRFDSDARDFMRCYEVRRDGSLKRRDGVWQVPKATQGLAVTQDMFVFSSSYGRNNRSRIYVVRRDEGSTDLDKGRYVYFHAPSMSEGITICGEDVYLVYESGAREYTKGADKPRNIIGRLHKTSLASLRKLCPRAKRAAA